MKVLARFTLTEEQEADLALVFSALLAAGDGASTLAQLSRGADDKRIMCTVGIVDQAQALQLQQIIAPEHIGSELVPLAFAKED